MNNVKRILVLSAVCGVMYGAYASDAGAGSGSGSSYVEVVDAEGRSKFDAKLMKRLAQITEESTQESLLHKAAFRGDIDAIRALVYWGVDVDTQDWFFNTPLHRAVEGKQQQAIVWLLLLGASKQYKNQAHQTPRECAVDDEGRVLFDTACEQYCMMRELGVSCMPLFSKEMRVAATAKMFEITQHMRGLWVLELALISGADCTAVDSDGNTPLHHAVKPVRAFEAVSPPSFNMLQLLIHHGVQRAAVNFEGKTAAQVARDNGFVEAAELLTTKSQMKALLRRR
jgi:ankyrin repeat protein